MLLSCTSEPINHGNFDSDSAKALYSRFVVIYMFDRHVLPSNN